MKTPWYRVLLPVLTLLTAMQCLAQDFPIEISAANLPRLSSVARIDFAALDLDIEIGWFAANRDASEFLVFDDAGKIFMVDESSVRRSWAYVSDTAEQVFTFIDALLMDDAPLVLYAVDRKFFVNRHSLDERFTPVAMFPGAENGEFVIESLDEEGNTWFLLYRIVSDAPYLELMDTAVYPTNDNTGPAVRIGRVGFPIVITSSLVDHGLSIYRYPDSFTVESSRQFRVEHGPAVFGAVNRPATSHIGWSDPGRTHLSILDLQARESRFVADLSGAYAQYLLLSNDASSALAVNLDFQPLVVAWDVETGAKHQLGMYRKCNRIPDNVDPSPDGSALIIGCDTGLDVWRIDVEREKGK